MSEQEILKEFWWYTKDMPEQQKELTNELILKAYELGYGEGHLDGQMGCDPLHETP